MVSIRFTENWATCAHRSEHQSPNLRRAPLGKKWGLKSGEVYDRSYAGRFFLSEAAGVTTQIANERDSQGKPRPNIDTREVPNRQTLIVNVVIELKN